MKKALRKILPLSVRHFIWTLFPQLTSINTLVLDKLEFIETPITIPDKYLLREVAWTDQNELKKFYRQNGATTFKRKVPKRLNSPNCRGFAFFDNSTGEIVYITWIVHNFSQFLNEFGLKVAPPLILWESALCLPEHRHKGLHERMEQELLNYAVLKGAKFFYMQIHEASQKGNSYALSKGYKILCTRKVISWPFFDVFRDYSSFLKKPFRKIIF